MPRRLRKLQAVAPALAAAVAVALALAATGCGDDDSGKQKVDRKQAERQKAYATAFEQCNQFGADPLRAKYGKNQSLAVLAQLFVTEQIDYYRPYEQAAFRGCEAGLGR